MRKTCLIIDSSRMLRRVAGRIVSDMQFKYEEAENGQDAMDICRLNMPDAILVDGKIPVMDGVSFLKCLRETPGGAQPRVVFCSSDRSVEKITEALEAGADEYIMKPFDSDIVRSKFFEIGLLSA